MIHQNGIEELLGAMNLLRRNPERYWEGAGSYTAHRSAGLDDAVLSVQRAGATRMLDIFVNLSPTDDSAVALPTARDRAHHFWHGLSHVPALIAASAVLPPYAILIVSTSRSSSRSE